jgi:hypothetical protein
LCVRPDRCFGGGQWIDEAIPAREVQNRLPWPDLSHVCAIIPDRCFGGSHPTPNRFMFGKPGTAIPSLTFHMFVRSSLIAASVVAMD